MDPFISVKFIKETPEDGSDPLVSLVIFEWRDEHLIGKETQGAENVGSLVSLLRQFWRILIIHTHGRNKQPFVTTRMYITTFARKIK